VTDLIPQIGATLGAVIVSLVGFASDLPTGTTVHAAPAVAEGAAEKAFPVCSVDSHPALRGRGVIVVAGVPLVCAAGSERLPLVDGPRSWAPRAPPGR
ncbi:hypothetical protein ABZ403_18330, partial [Micromonospora zamorensis]|uniref:hypothetical protein n=1 Tax=Micromonospora zamorensis TaxID=709883 RepID=UPI0034003B8C